MAGALVFTAFDNVFPRFFSIIMALWVMTNNIDFSSWSCHGVHQENGSTAHYNKLSYIRTLPTFEMVPEEQYVEEMRRLRETIKEKDP
ncbi:MAG: hypothetical protein C4B59_01280 [Candidatus Methanogaster sp.]|uniref:Uncharacterized protein n=1 Tax=Candidatus Methanogaster sp. TaxID=3386292 RepID=A0AC61L630_9EURY|nr:MAG: hypothetical protein C4B59_01280 [ANME-2 cluster archaeon]